MCVGLAIAGYGVWVRGEMDFDAALPFLISGGIVLLVGAVLNHRDHIDR